MAVVTKISFTPDGSIRVDFPLDKTRPAYFVQWGVVSLMPHQAEEAEDKWGWTNLGSVSRPEVLEQGMVEVRRSMMTHVKRLAELKRVEE